MSLEVFDNRPLNTVTYITPEHLFSKADNFMAYFYLYRSKLKHKTLLKISLDKVKKFDEKQAHLLQSKAKEVEYLSRLREEDSGHQELKKELENQRLKIEALNQERLFLFNELVHNVSSRSRANSNNFAIQEEPLEKQNELLIEENKDLKMHIEELNSRILDLEEEDLRKTSELKLNKRLLNHSKSINMTENESSLTSKILPADVCRKLVETQHENEE